MAIKEPVAAYPEELFQILGVMHDNDQIYANLACDSKNAHRHLLLYAPTGNLTMRCPLARPTWIIPHDLSSRYVGLHSTFETDYHADVLKRDFACDLAIDMEVSTTADLTLQLDGLAPAELPHWELDHCLLLAL